MVEIGSLRILLFCCLNDALAVDDEEGVVGKMRLGVQHPKGPRHLRWT